MMRTMGLALALGLWIAPGVLPQQSVTPPACQLLTAKEASTLMGGMALTVNPNDAARSDFNCRYNPSPTSFDGVEITYRTFPNSQAAHTYFPKWVIPVPPMPASMSMHPVSAVGDEAVILNGPIAKGIYFRLGAVLVKMGTHPPGVATDTALTTAAQTMIGRM
jgi:hypothetical protein